MKPKQEINISNHYDYDLAENFDRLAGGNKEKCEKIIENVSQKHVEQLKPHQDVEDMVKQAYDLKKQFQLENPIKLDPKTATFEQVGFHAERWQRLSQSTIEHRLRCARRMRKHPIFPIDFNDLSYNQFIAYMDTRERYEGASGYALMNDLRTIQMSLRVYSIDQRNWYYKLPILPRHKKRIIPFPEKVHEFFITSTLRIPMKLLSTNI